jgi:hypothetical protein
MLGGIIALALVHTTIPLAALGYPDGIPLTGGAVTLRLPVQPGVQRIGVRFPIEASGALAHAQIRLYIDGHEVAARSGDALRNATIEANAAVGKGKRAIDITLLSRLTQCSERAATDRTVVKSTGAVIVTQDATAARSTLGGYAGAYTIIEPPHPDATWRAHALAAAYALHVVVAWRRVAVALGATPKPDTQGISDLNTVALPERAPPLGERTFADLGVYPLEQSDEVVDYVVPFSLGQLGGVPNRLVATLKVRASAPGRIEARLNGREINDFPFSAGTQTSRVPIAVARLRGANTLLLEVRFSHPQTFCRTAPPEVALDGSDLRWSGHGDIAMTLERRLGELSGRVVIASDQAVFPQAFVVMSTIGSVNRSIDAIDVRPSDTRIAEPGEIEIVRAGDVETENGRSFGEVRLEPNGALIVSYIGDPSVLDRLPEFRGVLAGSDATNFEFGATGAILTQGGPFSTALQRRQRRRQAVFVLFLVVLAASTYLIARRARRFS